MDDIDTRLKLAIGQRVSVGYTHGDDVRHPIGTLLHFDQTHITLGFATYIRTYIRTSLIWISIDGECP